jgi:hypothetical protein
MLELKSVWEMGILSKHKVCEKKNGYRMWRREKKICIWLGGEDKCVRVWEDECVKIDECVKDVQCVITEGEYVKCLIFLNEKNGLEVYFAR